MGALYIRSKVDDQWFIYRSYNGFVQSRPRNLVTSFLEHKCVSIPLGTNREKASRWAGMIDTIALTGAGTYDMAYDRLVSQLGNTAGWGVNLAQWKQSESMIVQRSSQILDFTRGILTRNPRAIARSLGWSVKRTQAKLDTALSRGQNKKYGNAVTPANLWLEFWFGWKPLFSDIYDSCKILADPVPTCRIQGTATKTGESKQNLGFPGTEKLDISVSQRYRLGCDIAISNPNTYLFNQLGLMNPALVVYDMIPFSFLLGWVSNVDSYLRSWTDFAGVEIQRGFIVEKRSFSGLASWIPVPGDPVYELWKTAFYGVRKSRTPVSSFPTPSFHLKPINWSPVRAATSISLLLQQLYKVGNH